MRDDIDILMKRAHDALDSEEEITITVSGPAGSGKNAVAAYITRKLTKLCANVTQFSDRGPSELDPDELKTTISQNRFVVREEQTARGEPTHD